MVADPILNAETLIATALRNAIAPVVGDYNGRPRVYEGLAEQGAPLPLVVFQFQAPITPTWYLDRAGASALVTIKTLAHDIDSARSLLAQAAACLTNLSAPGHSIIARYVSSPRIPVLNGVHTSAHQWRISLERM